MGVSWLCRGIGGFLRVSRGTGRQGKGFWGCSRNKCREHRGKRGESPCRAREGVKSGLWGFLGRSSRVIVRKRSMGSTHSSSRESFIC